MSEWRYRLRRLVFGPPAWATYTPEDRAGIREWMALLDDQPQPLPTEPFHLAGRSWRQVCPVEGLAEELAFRRYARRSGEHVR